MRFWFRSFLVGAFVASICLLSMGQYGATDGGYGVSAIGGGDPGGGVTYPDPNIRYEFVTASPLANSGTDGATYNLINPGGAASPVFVGDEVVFNGGDYLRIPQNNFLQGKTKYTLMVWAKETTAFRLAAGLVYSQGANVSPPSSTAVVQGIMHGFTAEWTRFWSRTDDPILGYTDMLNSANLEPANSLITNGDPIQNQWRFYAHVVDASDNSHRAYYSDSAGNFQIHRELINANPFTQLYQNDFMYVGANDTFSFSGSSTWVGPVDDVAIWFEQALTLEEIQAYFDETKVGRVP